MLGDVKKVEDMLYSNESIQDFLKTRSIHELIKLLNKTTKNETKVRIKRLLYKINESNYYKQFLQAGLDQDKQKREEFTKYIRSDECQEYYELLQKKPVDLVTLLQVDIEVISILFSLVYQPQGIKMIKTISSLFENYGETHDCLYREEIKEELRKGVGYEGDSVVQMRFVEIAANIAIHGGKSFQFAHQILQKSLDVYNTEDILLKLNIVQTVSILGSGVQTAQLLRGHKIWKNVQKDAMDAQQQFFVRKCLLILLIDMSTYQQYTFNTKITKNIISFLHECLSGQGQYLEAGLEISSHLCRSTEGIKILAQNKDLFNLLVKLSRSTQDMVKNQYIQTMTMLTDKQNGKKTKVIVLNFLNCIGNPNLSGEFSQNITSSNVMVGGIIPFCKWFVGFLLLPFEEFQLKLIKLFQNIVGYMEICDSLFEEQSVTKFLLKPISSSQSSKILKKQKNLLVHSIIEKGQKEWKGTKLETYSIMIEKELQREKMEVQYMMDTQ